MLNFLIAAFFLIMPGYAFESLSNYSFFQFKREFARDYAEGGDEHNVRKAIFAKQLADIVSHNAQGRPWKKGVNHLTDLTDSEMKQRLGYDPSWKRMHAAPEKPSSYLELTDEESACTSRGTSCRSSSCCSGLICGVEGTCVEIDKKDAVDWAEMSATAYNVLEQGGCGSCWAVAAAAAVQLHAEIVARKMSHVFKKVVSPRRLLSCTQNPLSCGGEGGCRGATAELAFKWLADQGEKGGILPIDLQAYDASEHSEDCASPSSPSFLHPKMGQTPMIGIKGFRNVEANKADAMRDALVNVGPVVASIVGAMLRQYQSGVIDYCDNFVIDHAVVMMGYGRDSLLNNGIEYWKIRNSWGPAWGERGHFRLQRFSPTSDEPCGVDTDPSKGVACKDKMGPDGHYPDKQWWCGACGILSDTAYPFGTFVPKELMETM